MPASTSVDFKRGDRIKLKDEKAQCLQTLQTLFKKNDLTKEHLTSGAIKILSFHGGTLRAEHPVSGKPCLINASIFQKATD